MPITNLCSSRPTVRIQELLTILLHLYNAPVKFMTWYFPIFGYMLDLCFTNSWLAFKRKFGLQNNTLILRKESTWQLPILNQVNKPVSKVNQPSFSIPPPLKKSDTPKILTILATARCTTIAWDIGDGIVFVGCSTFTVQIVFGWKR